MLEKCIIKFQVLRGTIKTPTNELENELYHMLRSHGKDATYIEPVFPQYRLAWLGVQYDTINNR